MTSHHEELGETSWLLVPLAQPIVVRDLSVLSITAP
jgi:hypothetical protein